MQYATDSDSQASTQGEGNILSYSPIYVMWRPKHAVSEVLMTLAEDLRPEADVLIDMSDYALTHQPR